MCCLDSFWLLSVWCLKCLHLLQRRRKHLPHHQSLQTLQRPLQVEWSLLGTALPHSLMTLSMFVLFVWLVIFVFLLVLIRMVILSSCAFKVYTPEKKPIALLQKPSPPPAAQMEKVSPPAGRFFSVFGCGFFFPLVS